MSRRFFTRILRWLFPVLLLAGACWTGNLTLFHLWVSGGPPTDYADLHSAYANLSFAATVVLILLALLVALVNLRRSKAAR